MALTWNLPPSTIATIAPSAPVPVVPTKAAGHTLGLVGSFLVQDNETTLEEDRFSQALANLGQRLTAPEATLLDREILSPEEWLNNSYYSGPLAKEYWPQKRKDFIQAAQGSITEVILTGAIGIGKCLRADSVIVDARGIRSTIKKMVGSAAVVPSLHGSSLKYSTADHIWRSGKKECARMLLASGQHLDASLDHPVLGPDGYHPLGELKPGDFVAVARHMPAPPSSVHTYSDSEVICAAYLIADGSLHDRQPMYTKDSRVLVDELVEHASNLPGWCGVGQEAFKSGAWRVSLKGITPWVQQLGIDELSKNKRVPATFFGLPNRQLALFLARLYTDGNVYIGPTGAPRRIELAFASEGLIDDVQLLLRRFGVVARKSYAPKRAAEDGPLHDAWRLWITDAPNQLRFLDCIGAIPGKEVACANLHALCLEVASNPNWDVVPIGVEELKEIRRETGPHKKGEWRALAGLQAGSVMGRDRFRRLCEVTGYRGRFYKFAEMDVVWERVESISPQGMHEVYDLHVPGTENFVANGIIVHNSAILKGLCMYDLYRLSCFREPQRALGIGSADFLVMVLVSLNVTKSKAKLLDPLKNAINLTPYFRKEFPFDPRKESVLEFPKGIVVKTGVTGESAVHSEDVIWLGVSEANFMPVVQNSRRKRGTDVLDVAADLVEATIRRMKSRFMQGAGLLPLCRLVLDSSRQYPDDFVERRIVDINGGRVGHEAVVISRAIWEAKAEVRNPAGDLYFKGERFAVEVGNEQRFSRIITPEEVPFARGEVVWVPEELREEFQRDIEGALRDFGGRAVLSLKPLISNREAITECIRDEGRFQEFACLHPFSAPATTLKDQVVLLERLLADPDTKKPRVNPDCLRTVHVDFGLTGDCLGFSMGHIEEMVLIARATEGQSLDLPCVPCRGEKELPCARCAGSGKVTHFKQSVRCSVCRGKQRLACMSCRGTGKHGVPIERPRVYIDIMLQVVPPDGGGQIQFDDVEALIERLRALGFRIPVVTADGYESAQFLQRQMSQYGALIAEPLSMDKTKDPYYALRNAVLDRDHSGRRRVSWYDYDVFIQEVSRVEDRPQKVDHPYKGSKDVADAVAGVVFNCERIPQLQLPVEGSSIRVDRF